MLTYVSCVLEISGSPYHGAVYSPPRALRLRRGLVAAREPLQPDLSARTRHVTALTTVHFTPESFKWRRRSQRGTNLDGSGQSAVRNFKFRIWKPSPASVRILGASFTTACQVELVLRYLYLCILSKISSNDATGSF